MEIAPAVHLVDGVRGANCYLVTEPKPTLIDTGLPGQGRRVLGYLAGLGYQPGQLCHIVLTHYDLDHIGSAAELKELTGARVLMHPVDAEYVLGKLPRKPRWKAGLCWAATAMGWLKVPPIDGVVEEGGGGTLQERVHGLGQGLAVAAQHLRPLCPQG